MSADGDHRRIKGPNTMVSRWRGAHAVLDVSFRGVSVLLYRDYEQRLTQNLTIGLAGPDWLQGPLSWENADIEVHAPDAPSVVGLAVEGLVYEVVDLGSGFRAIGPNLGVAENRRLRWFRG